MGKWIHVAITTTAILGAIATSHARGETVEFGNNSWSYKGWTRLHRAAEEGSVEKIDALLLDGHYVDERVTAGLGLEKGIEERQIDEALKQINEALTQLRKEAWQRSSWRLKVALKALGQKEVIEKEVIEKLMAALKAESKAALTEEGRKEAREKLMAALKASLKAAVKSQVRMWLEGATALHIAAGGGHYAAAERLIEKGADVNAETTEGIHPVHFAALADEVQTLRLMLEHGANPEEPSTMQGLRPLHWATFGNAVQTARELLKRGVDVNATAETGATAMDIANYQHGSAAYLLQEALKRHGGRCKMICDPPHTR